MTPRPAASAPSGLVDGSVDLVSQLSALSRLPLCICLVRIALRLIADPGGGMSGWDGSLLSRRRERRARESIR